MTDVYTHTVCFTCLCVRLWLCVCVFAWAADGWESSGLWITGQTQKHNELGCNLSYLHTHTYACTLNWSERLIKKLRWADSRMTTYKTTIIINVVMTILVATLTNGFKVLKKIHNWKEEKTPANTLSHNYYKFNRRQVIFTFSWQETSWEFVRLVTMMVAW